MYTRLRLHECQCFVEVLIGVAGCPRAGDLVFIGPPVLAAALGDIDYLL